METKKELFTIEQSVCVASDYLEQSRKESTQIYSKHFLLWSAVVMIDAYIIRFLMSFSNSPFVHLLWLIIPVVGCFGEMLIKKKASISVGYIGKLLSKLWVVFGVISIIVCALGCIFQYNPVFCLIPLFALANIFSGVLLKEKIIVAITSIACASSLFLCFYFSSATNYILMIAVCANVLFFSGLFLKNRK